MGEADDEREERGRATARYAEVAVNSGQPAREPFTYAIPEGMSLEAGQAVFVPFGPRVLQGIVLALSDQTGLQSVRPIDAVADASPVLDEPHIALARWLSATYLAPLWDCVSACLPSGYGQKPVTMVSPVEVPPLLPVYPGDQKVLQAIVARGQMTIEALREATGPLAMARLQRLQSEGYLTVAQGLARPGAQPRMERRIALSRPAGEAAARAAELGATNPRSVDARVLRLLAAEGEVPLSWAREAGAQAGHIRRLAVEGWLRDYEARVQRSPLQGHEFAQRPPLVLTGEQEVAAAAIAAAEGTYLLQGVTGSGKTEVYLDLVRRALEAGRGAILLVPEIALTPQAIRRYGERFGETLTVLHSGLSAGELYDQWYRIQRGESRLVLGSRSALFAPVRNLGLVVLDEEHEWSYKQADPQPRYHAREAAEELCRRTHATLVLGSATPDIVTYHRAEVGYVTRVELRERVSPGEDGSTRQGEMPLISVVDMREELKGGNRGVFSLPLRRALLSALRAGEQSILFVNRRGSARFMLCRDCGHLPLCPSCEVAMGLDLSDPHHPRVSCHACGRGRRLEDRCPKCDGGRYRPFGVGTQRIEQEARLAFPGARIARWDSDIASKKGSHERIVNALEAREIDVLVGTQMLAKGLDLPGMTVVGVVDADVGLSLPDYHAQERTFQLLSQVAGRAGRRDRAGRVYIQTYDPEAPPIQCAAQSDYRAFYDYEIAHRRRAGYPPFARLARLVYHSTNREHGLQEASRVAADLRLRRDAAGRAEPDVLGPTPAYIARVRGQYRWQLLLRGKEPGSLVARVRLGQGWSVDIDPASLL
ncbi:MAG: replication restart helicase PriA [Tepidiformaceae bacterium]